MRAAYPQRSLARGYSDRAMFIGIFLAALVLGLALWGFRYAQNSGTSSVSALQTVLLYPKPKTLAPFQLDELQRQGSEVRSQAFDNSALHGKWRLLFFGFTTCPDICPTTLSDLKSLSKQLGPQAPELVFVSVDPERDKPLVLRDYVDFFDPAIRSVSSSDLDKLTRFASELGALFVKVEDAAQNGYTIDHSASLFLINPQGQLAGLIRPPLQIDRIAQDLRSMIQTSGAP
jgi:protein SCO1